MTRCWANGTVALQYGATKVRHNIHCTKPNTSDTDVEDINIETYIWRYLTYDQQLYTSAL